MKERRKRLLKSLFKKEQGKRPREQVREEFEKEYGRKEQQKRVII
jgi:SepF-like predicted cell division protein (DUF552 family)